MKIPIFVIKDANQYPACPVLYCTVNKYDTHMKVTQKFTIGMA